MTEKTKTYLKSKRFTATVIVAGGLVTIGLCAKMVLGCISWGDQNIVQPYVAVIADSVARKAFKIEHAPHVAKTDSLTVVVDRMELRLKIISYNQLATMTEAEKAKARDEMVKDSIRSTEIYHPGGR